MIAFVRKKSLYHVAMLMAKLLTAVVSRSVQWHFVNN